ncbi:O119 family O-antigen polymerase [Escherichia albertii]|nr:O119 family O-antigen polymerase [Escherichia albertii]
MIQRSLGARTCLYIFLFTAFVSYLNALLGGKFNGDFSGVNINLDFIQLLGVFILTCAPFLFLWCVYSLFNRIKFKELDAGQLGFRVSVFFKLFVFWSFFVTINYGVGIMAKSEYNVPAAISYIIYFTNRIDVFYLGVLFILLYQGRFLFFWIFILCVLGVIRGGIGVFLYVSMALILRYNIILGKFFFRRPLLCFLALIISPFVVDSLFYIRELLRGDYINEQFTFYQLIIGKLIGRFSSFSNLGMIFQNEGYFLQNTFIMDQFYFVKHFFSAFIGQSIIPDIIPERLLINIFGGDLFDKSYMVGLSGNMYISSMISPTIMMINLILIFISVICTFIVAGLIGFKYSREYAFALLLYPCMSGSAQEFAKLLLSMLFIMLILASCNIKLKIKRGFAGGERV